MRCTAAFTMGQQSMAGRIADPWSQPWPQPATHGAGKGKGKFKPADPFHAMVAEGLPKGKGTKGKEGKGKEGQGKEDKDKRDPRKPLPCSRCGSFFVCAKIAAGKGQELHCTNPQCERSLEFALLTLRQQKLLLAVNLAAKKAAAADAAVAATEAGAAAAAAAALPPVWPAAGAAAWAAGAPVVIDDTQLSPLTPADAAAAAGHSDTDVSSPDG